jgi:hypothetical protein
MDVIAFIILIGLIISYRPSRKDSQGWKVLVILGLIYYLFAAGA